MNNFPNFRIFMFLFLFMGLTSIKAQKVSSESCAFALKEANQLYSEGQVEKIPELIKDCITYGFSKEDKQNAYKLIILSYLYGDERSKADSAMFAFLKRYPQYELTPTDPGIFEQLFKSFKTMPVISMGVTIGTNLSFPYYFESYGFGNLPTEVKDYQSGGSGLNLGIQFYKPLTKSIEICIEPTFVQTKFAYKAQVLPDLHLEFSANQNLIGIPVTANYFYYNRPNIEAFAKLGISYFRNLSASGNATTTATNTVPKQSPSISILNFQNPNQFNLILGTGIKYKLPRGYAFFDVRYSFGLTNQTIPDQRYPNSEDLSGDVELFYTYKVLFDDFRINNIFFSAGYVFPIYKVKKL